MKKIKTLLAGLLLLSAGVAAANPAVVKLAVEFQTQPLAIDTPQPRFSWEVKSEERGARQGAYQVVVARSEEDLNRPGKALWDSGRVKSSQSSGVVYAGPALQSRTRYFWKVRAWGEDGKPWEQSEPASFQTGLMSQQELRGQWVWESDQVKPMDYAYFRTEFELADSPAQACALASAHNSYVLFVNGQRVSGYVSPGISNPYKSKLYITYDLAPFLRKGRNAVAAMAFYKGAGGQNYVNGTPGFLFEAWGKSKDGKEFSLASGPGWKVLAQTPFDESAPWLSNRKHTAAEFFDGRKEPVGWKQSGFDDTSWKPAVVVNPGYILRSQYMPESNVEKELTPEKVSRPWPGVYLFSLPEEISGWGKITASAPAGTKLTMRYADRLVLGRAFQGAANEPTKTYFDKYTFAGKGVENFEPNFGFRGFRFIEVTGFKGRLTADNLKGVFAHTLLPQTAGFESSNELLNRIYQISVHTQKTGMLGQVVDCANREQSQWHADAEIQSGTIFYNFYDPHIIRKTLLDFRDGQWDDGRLPDFYPASPRDFNYIPEWDLHYMPMLWRTYYYYNDRYILEDCFEVVARQIAYYESLRDASGLLGKGEKGKGRVWHISDWPEDFAKMDQKGQYLTIENLLYYDTLNKAADMARILGRSEDEIKWRAAAAELKDAINKNLYDPATKAYLDSSGSRERHQGASALALQVGVVPESERKAVMDYVKNQGFGTSIVLAYNLMEMLYDNDEGEFAYSLVNSENFPGWGYMLKKGATSTWESWVGPINLITYEHPFAAFMARFFISGLVGIKPAAPGFAEIEIRPHPAGDLKWAKARMRILPGEVAASWEKSNDGFKLAVETPGNTRARICIPVPADSQVKILESGKKLWPERELGADPNIKFLQQENNYIDFEVGSGTYSFQAL